MSPLGNIDFPSTASTMYGPREENPDSAQGWRAGAMANPENSGCNCSHTNGYLLTGSRKVFSVIEKLEMPVTLVESIDETWDCGI